MSDGGKERWFCVRNEETKYRGVGSRKGKKSGEKIKSGREGKKAVRGGGRSG